MEKNGNNSKTDAVKGAGQKAGEVFADLKGRGKVLLNEGIETARHAYEQKAEDLRKKAKEIGDKSVEELGEDLKYYVRSHPLRSIAIALGLGALVGYIFKSDK